MSATSYRPTQRELMLALRYFPSSGRFVWRKRSTSSFVNTATANGWNKKYAGNEAGCVSRSRHVDYRVIWLNSRKFLAHHLAWLYMTGEWPPGHMDHKDGDGLNNQWKNLRIATASQNQMNRGPNRNNKLGIKGICQTGPKSFKAWITTGRQRMYLGSFPTAKEAAAAYQSAAKQQHGKFYRRPD